MKLGLQRDYFTSEQIYAQESKRIFATHWLCVGRSDAAGDGEYFTSEIESASVLCVRSNGTLRAFHNVCRHRGAILCDEAAGKIQHDCLTCQYHAWSYGPTGELLTAPNMSATEGWEKSEYGLTALACAEWNGYVFVNFAQSPTPFSAAFAAVHDKFDSWNMSALRVGFAVDYEVQANWKLIFQNYSECYHCPTVHPALNRLSPYKSAGNDLLAGAFLGGPMQLNGGVETMSTDGKSVAKTLPSLGEQQHRLVGYYTLFPSIFISPHPDYVLVHRLKRAAIDRTQVTCELLFHPEGDADPQRAADFWDQTNRQDWHVCELVQRGANSVGHRAGPYSPNESVLPKFDEHYLSVM